MPSRFPQGHYFPPKWFEVPSKPSNQIVTLEQANKAHTEWVREFARDTMFALQQLFIALQRGDVSFNDPLDPPRDIPPTALHHRDWILFHGQMEILYRLIFRRIGVDMPTPGYPVALQTPVGWWIATWQDEVSYTVSMDPNSFYKHLFEIALSQSKTRKRGLFEGNDYKNRMRIRVPHK